MPSATSLISKADSLLTRFNATDRAVYKRTITRTGGDPLIGKPASVTRTDVKLNPPPAVSRPNPNDPLIIAGNTVVPATDYVLLVTPTALTRAELGNKDLMIVFKDGSTEEELAVVAYTPEPFQGMDVIISVLVRSKKQ
jgi:hypothetical protein